MLLCKQTTLTHISRFLTHWGRVTHICVGKLTSIGSDNGLSPDRRQAIIWTNAGLLLIGPLGTNFSEILIEILKFSFKKTRLNVSSAKRRRFCPGLNVLSTDVSTCFLYWWQCLIFWSITIKKISIPICSTIRHHPHLRISSRFNICWVMVLTSSSSINLFTMGTQKEVSK